MNALIGALLGFVLGQVVKFFFEPVYRLREAIGQVDYVLGYYADVYMNPGERGEKIEYPTEARDGLRRAAFDLRAKAAAVPCLGFFSKIGLVPNQPTVYKVVMALTGLSNGLAAPQGLVVQFRDANEKRRKEIVTTLGLHDLFETSKKGGDKTQ